MLQLHAGAAERAATATENAVEIVARQTAERQLRAYVHIVGKDFLIQGDEHERSVNQFSVRQLWSDSRLQTENRFRGPSFCIPAPSQRILRSLSHRRVKIAV